MRVSRWRSVRASKDRLAPRRATPIRWNAWMAALVIAGVAAVLTATASGDSTAGLIGSWTLNEASGTVAPRRERQRL